MPSAVRFITKDSHPQVRAVIEQKTKSVQGRRYTPQIAQDKIDAIQSADLVKGMQYAALSITDDTPNTLANVAKTNPWQLQAMTMLCNNNEEEAHLPLSTILHKYFDLQLDHIMDISGMSPAGHALDTQGYIAHNDTTIVLAYRCTTSAKDWITNLTTTSSAWELDVDVPQGHSGYFSSCVGFGCFPCTSPNHEDINYAPPRVHTGFYNNFLVTVPIIRKYIDPLLGPDQPPRTLYVVGHSLGAGIAVMAACYFLLEQERYNWLTMAHKLRIVTAGGPRACCQSMQQTIDTIYTQKYKNTDKVILARIVRDKDVVPTVPPELFGFRHLNYKLVYITKENPNGMGTVLINPDLRQVLSKRQYRRFLQEQPEVFGIVQAPSKLAAVDDDNDIETESSTEEDNNNYSTDIVTPTCLPDGAAVDETDIEVYHAAADDADTTRNNRNQAVDDEQRQQKAAQAEAAAAAEKAAKYEKFIACIPRAFRDHMPEFYLRPLLYLQEQEQRALLMEQEQQDQGSQPANVGSNVARSSQYPRDETESSKTSDGAVSQQMEYQPLQGGSSSWSSKKDDGDDALTNDKDKYPPLLEASSSSLLSKNNNPRKSVALPRIFQRRQRKNQMMSKVSGR